MCEYSYVYCCNLAMIERPRVCCVLYAVQYICSTRYPGPRFVSRSMSEHLPNAGDIFVAVNSLPGISSFL